MLSSNNFGDAYKRWQYFRQYDKFRKRQSKLIGETLKSLEAKNDLLTQKKQQKTMLLGTNEQQATLLTVEKQNKDQLLLELKVEETRLSSTLQNQNKQNAQMNIVIERLIAAEIEIKRKAAEARARRAREEADRLAREKERIKKRDEARQLKEKPDKIVEELPASNKPKSDLVITESAENLALSSEFRQNKGKLPPPATGVIVRDFGRQRVLDKVTTINNGIDIRTENGAEVRAVFSGTVLVVSSISGLGNVVLIQHGNYYTVYSNLSAVFVKKGEAVSTRQSIGRAGVNTVTKEPEIHFEVWLEKTHLNPTQWIAR
ncbi:MAG: M23 family metallopeptidase [Saprospiraceae bacterium]|nr:M23 family metallopeptidase [Saprospiraceae bacterium]